MQGLGVSKWLAIGGTGHGEEPGAPAGLSGLLCALKAKPLIPLLLQPNLYGSRSVIQKSIEARQLEFIEDQQ